MEPSFRNNSNPPPRVFDNSVDSLLLSTPSNIPFNDTTTYQPYRDSNYSNQSVVNPTPIGTQFFGNTVGEVVNRNEDSEARQKYKLLKAQYR
ncbi:hypothetical protein HK098_007522, partial [Nowakowskiella sp. JEL0407]